VRKARAAEVFSFFRRDHQIGGQFASAFFLALLSPRALLDPELAHVNTVFIAVSSAALGWENECQKETDLGVIISFDNFLLSTD